LGAGGRRWGVDLGAVFKAREGYLGVGTTPLVAATPAGRVVSVKVGADDAGVVGFDLATGTVRWRTADARASYSAPVLAASESAAPAVIVPTRLFTTALDPATGRELWRVPFGQRGPSVVAALPVVVDDQVLLTASYGVGARLLDLSGSAGDAPTVGWSSASLSSHYPTPVVVDGFVYGIDGREDVGSAHLRCLDLTTGDVRWSVDGFGIAHLLTDGQRLLIQRLDGEIILADASAEAFRPLARAAVAEGPVRALPALSGGVLYLRTTPSRGGGELLAIVLGAS
ncbi:MAG: PQQ-binding-like beta-propeller repeat protein, partial [Acidobacteriota bacterium]